MQHFFEHSKTALRETTRTGANKRVRAFRIRPCPKPVVPVLREESEKRKNVKLVSGLRTVRDEPDVTRYHAIPSSTDWRWFTRSEFVCQTERQISVSKCYIIYQHIRAWVYYIPPVKYIWTTVYRVRVSVNVYSWLTNLNRSRIR